MKKVILAAFLFGLFGVTYAFCQGQDFSKVEMKVQKVGRYRLYAGRRGRKYRRFQSAMTDRHGR